MDVSDPGACLVNTWKICYNTTSFFQPVFISTNANIATNEVFFNISPCSEEDSLLLVLTTTRLHTTNARMVSRGWESLV